MSRPKEIKNVLTLYNLVEYLLFLPNEREINLQKNHFFLVLTLSSSDYGTDSFCERLKHAVRFYVAKSDYLR